MKEPQEALKEAFDRAAIEAGYSFDGVNIEVRNGSIAIGAQKSIGGMAVRSGINICAAWPLPPERTVDDLARIAVIRSADFFRRAEAEYAEDVKVAAGEPRTSAPGSRIRELGGWLAAMQS